LKTTAPVFGTAAEHATWLLWCERNGMPYDCANEKEPEDCGKWEIDERGIVETMRRIGHAE
jgi:hypothetical protein